MTRYRVIHMPWRNWPFWVQRRTFFGGWEDVKDFAELDKAIDRAKAYQRGGEVVFDTSDISNPGEKQ